MLINFVVKKIARNCCQFFYKIFCIKTLFTTNFIKNIWEFYKFVGNNYLRRNYLSIKIMKNYKFYFLQFFFNFYFIYFSLYYFYLFSCFLLKYDFWNPILRCLLYEAFKSFYIIIAYVLGLLSGIVHGRSWINLYFNYCKSLGSKPR